VKIGVISDTHGFLDPKVPQLFAGVEHILHAGDVGPQSLLNELEQIAPVTAVTGNTDSFLALREVEVVTLAGKKVLVQHIVNPQALEAELENRLERAQPDIVVFGHTHKPLAEQVAGRLYFNPGYAGHSRFGIWQYWTGTTTAG
jgi:putative phosphoesterase